jgi:cell division protein FtsQ
VRAAAASLGRLPRAVVVLPRTLRLSPHGRRRLMVLALLAAVLAAGYWFWLRDSSLVRVEKVTVTGIDTADAPRVRAKLTEAARRMTTLHVNAEALRLAVEDEPVVHSLTVHPSFPHGLRIEIVENRPVALLVAGTEQVPVAPDGTVLEGAKISGTLPTVSVGSLPGDTRMPDGPARDRVALAAAAPPRLLKRIDTIEVQHGRGAVAVLKEGPVLIFGRAEALDRKWAAAAAVLAQSSSQGASYIDVRMPERPVAGGLDLVQDPQAQPEGATSDSPGVVPAVPPTDVVAPDDTTVEAPAATASVPGTTATTSTGTAPAAGTETATPAAPVTASTPATETQP